MGKMQSTNYKFLRHLHMKPSLTLVLTDWTLHMDIHSTCTEPVQREIKKVGIKTKCKPEKTKTPHNFHMCTEPWSLYRTVHYTEYCSIPI